MLLIFYLFYVLCALTRAQEVEAVVIRKVSRNFISAEVIFV